MKNIRVCQPTISDETIEELTKTLKTGWFGCGPKTAEFEQAFADRVGAKYAIGCNSGTSALDLCLKVRAQTHPLKGKKLVTTPLTFVSDAIVGEWHDMEVVFSDIDPETLCLDPWSIPDDPDIAVIIAVDSHGRLADIENIKQRFPNAWVVEDAAHAMYAEGVGEHADITMWSFQAVKTMPTADGGMITTNDERIAKELHLLKWLNVEKTTWDRSKGRKYTWDYDITRGDGIKSYMNDVTATIALGQMKRLDEMLAKRRTIQSRYNYEFRDIKEIKIPAWSDTVQYYTIQCENRDKLAEHLAEEGIATSVHFKPLYEMTYWKKAKKHDLPVCDRVWKKLLSLPCHDALTFEELEYVIKKVREYYGKD